MRFFRGARSPGNAAGKQGDRVCGHEVTDPGLPGQLAAAFAEPPGRPLLRLLVGRGEIVGREPLVQARERHRQALAELPAHAAQLSRGYPAIPTAFWPDDGNSTGA